MDTPTRDNPVYTIDWFDDGSSIWICKWTGDQEMREFSIQDSKWSDVNYDTVITDKHRVVDESTALGLIKVFQAMQRAARGAPDQKMITENMNLTAELNTKNRILSEQRGLLVAMRKLLS